MQIPQERRYPIAHDQTFVHLSAILAVSLGIPAMILGAQLAQKYGPGVAICSILVGNLVIWLIAMTIISMAIEDRKNAIENVRGYLGKYGAFFMVLVLIIAFLNWFVFQINTTVPSMGHFFGIASNAMLVRLGAGLGFFTALLAVGGIRMIKWLAVITAPAVFSYYVYAIARSDYSLQTPDWGVTISAIISTILGLLPGIVNLPTIFRHARTKADCYLALTIMTFVTSFFEISSIWMTFIDEKGVVAFGPTFSFFSIATFLFLLFKLFSTNLLNIYFASACWENFAPKFEGAKGYAIVGLIGTAAYTFIQVYAPILFLEGLANCYIASLGVVLLMAFLVRIVVHHRPRNYEKAINGFCWFIGCLIGTMAMIKNQQDGIDPVLMGIGSSTLVFLCIIFLEETLWAAKKIWNST